MADVGNSQSLYSSKPLPGSGSSEVSSVSNIVAPSYMYSSAIILSSSYYIYGASKPWYTSASQGTSWTIYDPKENAVVDSGTLCSKSDFKCYLSLKDGTYVWSVSGALDPYASGVSWVFCGTTGSISTELTFVIKSGKCYATHLQEVSALCESAETNVTESSVVLSGTVELFGAQGMTGNRHIQLLQDVISAELSDNSKHATILRDDVQLTSVHGDSAFTDHRKLSEPHGSKLSVTFTASLLKSWLGTRADADTEAVDRRVLALKRRLERSMTNGLFVARVVSRARLMDLSGLKSVSGAKLVELFQVHEHKKNAIESSVGSLFVIFGLVLGVVFGLLTLRSTRIRATSNSSYEAVEMDSSGSSTSHGNAAVVSSES